MVAAAPMLAPRGWLAVATCDHYPRAWCLQAQRCIWPGGGPAAARRRPGGGPAAARRRLGAAYSLPLGERGGGGGRGRCGPCGSLPLKQEGKPSPRLARSSSNPAKAPAAIGSQPCSVHRMMCPASSCPRYHLRPSTADYVARCSPLATLHAPHLNHFSALATRCPSIPICFPPPSSGRFLLVE
jgi:hypothetical protein